MSLSLVEAMQAQKRQVRPHALVHELDSSRPLCQILVSVHVTHHSVELAKVQ